MTEADSVALRSGPVCLINSSAAWRQVVATLPPLAALPLDQSVWMDAVGGVLIPDSAPLQFCERSRLNWERGSASSTVSNIKSHFRNTTSVKGENLHGSNLNIISAADFFFKVTQSFPILCESKRAASKYPLMARQIEYFLHPSIAINPLFHSNKASNNLIRNA